MKELNIQKEIKQIKKISLTKDEKSKMLHNLSVYADFHKPVPSTFSIFSFIKINKKFVYVLASIVIFVLTGGSLTYASENSLPGDILYPIKTKLIEPAEMAMTRNPEARIRLETDFANKRLKEANDLDKLGRLTPEFKKELDERFNLHLNKYNEIKKNIEKDNSTSSLEKADKIQKEFDNKIKNYTDVLNKMDRDIKGIKKADKKEIKNILNQQKNIIGSKIDENKNTSATEIRRDTPTPIEKIN